MKIRFLQDFVDKFRGKIYGIGDLVRRHKYVNRIKNFSVIAFGSSHMGCANRPAPPPNGETTKLNFGFPYQDLYYSYNFYKYLNSKSTKTILLTFSVFSPGDVTIKSKLHGICVLYKLLFGVPYQYGNIAKEKKLEQLETAYNKKINKYKNKLKNSKHYIEDKPSYARILDKSPAAIEKLKIRAQKHFKINQRPVQMEYISKFLEDTKENSQKIYIILSPVTKYYKEALPASDIIYSELYKMVDEKNIRMQKL